MIEINKTSGRGDDKSQVKRRKQTHTVSRSGSTFSTALNRVLEPDIDGTLDDLLSQLGDQEKRFLQNQSDHEMEHYRALVQKVLKLILDDAFREKFLKRNRKNWGDFVIVEKINTRLLEIAEAVTRNNRAFDMLATVEEIRGLILDLLY